jgi:hypothetical protein
MTNATVITPMAPSEDAQRTIPPDVMEKVVIGGDLSELNAAQRAEYYTAVCRSLGLNPLTKPFEFLTLNGKLRLYALRDCTDQLRRLHGISIYIANRLPGSNGEIFSAKGLRLILKEVVSSLKKRPLNETSSKWL